MNRFTILLSALLAGIAFAALGQTTASTPNVPAPPTPKFLTEAAVTNLFEIDSSQVAISKSKDAKVRDFATKMVKDHTDAGIKFKQAVAEAKLQAPPEKLDAKHAGVMENLRKADGTAFDKAYIEAQYSGHVEAVALFEAYAAGGENARMKKFAQDLLPVLRSHLEHVRSMRS